MPDFTEDNLRHLLRRTEFVVRPSRLATLQAAGNLPAAVDDVLALNGTLRPGPGPVPYFDQVDYTDGHGNFDGGWTQYREASRWWIDYAARGGSAPLGPNPPPTWRALQEKMVLFWHGHFVTSWSQIHFGVHLMWQLHGYRRRALDNVVDLAREMAVSPAMLVYLSNAFSIAGEPNQNFARELMELFTLGVGNYTEGDVDAVARAWTGHNYSYATQRYQFNAGLHDGGTKTLFGQARNWDGPEVIDQILLQNADKQRVAARFLARKLWEFFAFVGPSAGLVEALADVLVTARMDVRAVMRAMLLRDEFYSPQARQGLVRAPLEWLVALAYHTNMTGADLNLIDLGPADHAARMSRSELTGQLIFQPPNVSGWRPNAYWLTASGLSGRAQLAQTAATFVLSDPRATPFNLRPTVGAAVDDAARYFGITYPPASTTRSAIVAAFGGESVAFPADGRHDLLMLTMLAPEMHLA